MLKMPMGWVFCRIQLQPFVGRPLSLLAITNIASPSFKSAKSQELCVRGSANGIRQRDSVREKAEVVRLE